MTDCLHLTEVPIPAPPGETHLECVGCGEVRIEVEHDGDTTKGESLVPEPMRYLVTCESCGAKDARETTRIGDRELRYDCGTCGYTWFVGGGGVR